MTGPGNERRVEVVRALVILAMISATYLAVVDQSAIAALWREFVRAQ